MSVLVFWVVKSCEIVVRNRRFVGNYCHHLLGVRTIEGVCSSETSTYMSTRHQNPTARNLKAHEMLQIENGVNKAAVVSGETALKYYNI